MICVDASIVAKWLFVEQFSVEADSLLHHALVQREPIVAPSLLSSEVLNIIRQRVRRGVLTLADAHARLTIYLAIPISFQLPDTFLGRALDLAVQYNLAAAYDAHYLALAEAFGCDYWTDDQRLLSASGGGMPYVRWIGNYRS